MGVYLGGGALQQSKSQSKHSRAAELRISTRQPIHCAAIYHLSALRAPPICPWCPDLRLASGPAERSAPIPPPLQYARSYAAASRRELGPSRDVHAALHSPHGCRGLVAEAVAHSQGRGAGRVGVHCGLERVGLDATAAQRGLAVQECH